MVFETYGRAGADTGRSLELIASHVGGWLLDAWAAPRLVPKCRATLARIVQFAAVDIHLLSFG